ncbi:hypothetical protein ACIGXA_28075 [Streptomyces fildesensis]|uniref:Lipoprotein n=1 Tax=Streptomyces fildesensis TaxID=375757 RepID=A0ABW8CD52_9ACTN
MSRSTPRIGLLGVVLALIAALLAGVLTACATPTGSASGPTADPSGSGVSSSSNTFPTEEVYGPDPDPVLRLVTCDGALDAAGHPVDNLIVYASLR